MKEEMTQEKLKKLLYYNQETGIFTRRKSVCRWKKGEVAGSVNREGYFAIRIKTKHYLAHRLAWLYVYGYFPEFKIDHINRNRTDNRICNLRHVSDVCNARNRDKRCDNTSGVTGVYWRKDTKKWRSLITINKKIKYLGNFKNIDDAVKARYEAEVKYNWFTCQSDSSAYRYLKERNLI